MRQPQEMSEPHSGRTGLMEGCLCAQDGSGASRRPCGCSRRCRGRGQEARGLQQAQREEEVETSVRAHHDGAVRHGVTRCPEWAQQLSPISLHQSCVEEPAVTFTDHIGDGQSLLQTASGGQPGRPVGSAWNLTWPRPGSRPRALLLACTHLSRAFCRCARLGLGSHH